MRNRLLLLILALAGPLAAQEKDYANWQADFDAAMVIAKAEGKDLLVHFTGSDWCGWCTRLDEEVFSHESFLNPVQKKYVLVALDFPHAEETKAKVPNPKRNNELNQIYGVLGFPTILLINIEGQVFGRTGYQEGGPEKYVEDLTTLAEEGRIALKKVHAIQAEFAAAESRLARMAVIQKALKMAASMNEETAGHAEVLDLLTQGMSLDTDNKTGLKLKIVKALLNTGRLDSELIATAKSLDPKNEAGLLDQIVGATMVAVQNEESAKAAIAAVAYRDANGGFNDQNLAKGFYLNVAFWSSRFLDDEATAKIYAAKVKAMGDVDERAAEIIKEILGE